MNTLDVEQIIIGSQLGDARTWDVLEVQPDVVVATSNPGSNGFAYVTRIDIDFVNGHRASRLAGGRIIRASPVLARSSDGSALYVGEGFSPNSLYKLDMTDPSGPLVLEDDHGSVSGTDRLEVSHDNTLIFLRSGQVLRTSDFNQIGSIGSGLPKLNSDGSRCYVGTSSWSGSQAIQIWNTSTYLQVGEIGVPSAVDQMLLLEDKGYMAVLSGSTVYAIRIP
jgi:hypothetical protein